MEYHIADVDTDSMQIKNHYGPSFKNTVAFSHVDKFLCVQFNASHPPDLLPFILSFQKLLFLLLFRLFVLLCCLCLLNVLFLSRHFLLSFELQLAVVFSFSCCLSDEGCFLCFSHTRAHTHTSNAVAPII